MANNDSIQVSVLVKECVVFIVVDTEDTWVIILKRVILPLIMSDAKSILFCFKTSVH